MRLTRLHILLVVIIAAATGLFFASQYKKKAGKPVEKTVQNAVEHAVEIPVAPKVEPVPVPKVEPKTEIKRYDLTARDAIAVAGEYWKIARKGNRDAAKGQATLHEAKQDFQKGNYQEAIRLARRSIEELKNAPVKGSVYTVRRGDNLWKISKMREHYGRGAGWVKIWRANEKKIPDFDLICRGQVLNIPR